MSSAVGETAAMRRQPLLVDLALQGGGSHGAFTWGVLDRLLEEPWQDRRDFRNVGRGGRWTLDTSPATSRWT